MQLVASTRAAASITAFIAGPCSITSADVPGLVRALAKDQVTIASLATVAELGAECVAALHSLIDGLNDSSGTVTSHHSHAPDSQAIFGDKEMCL